MTLEELEGKIKEAEEKAKEAEKTYGVESTEFEDACVACAKLYKLWYQIKGASKWE